MLNETKVTQDEDFAINSSSSGQPAFFQLIVSVTLVFFLTKYILQREKNKQSRFSWWGLDLICPRNTENWEWTQSSEPWSLIWYLLADKQQEVDINNLRLEEEFSAGSSKAGAKGAGAGGSAAPLSLISGVKRPLGVTNRCWLKKV